MQIAVIKPMRATISSTRPSGSRHLRFARRLLSRLWRQWIRRCPVERVFGSPPYAPAPATVISSTARHDTLVLRPRVGLTLGPRIRLDLSIAPVPTQPGSTALGPAAPVAHITVPGQASGALPLTTIGAPPQSLRPPREIVQLRSVLAPARERIERDGPASTGVLVKTRRQEVTRRIETVVRRTQPAVAGAADPSGSCRGETDARARGATRAPRPRGSRAAAEVTVSDAEVTRITDRVVQQINRKLVAQRERMGRS